MAQQEKFLHQHGLLHVDAGKKLVYGWPYVVDYNTPHILSLPTNREIGLKTSYCCTQFRVWQCLQPEVIFIPLIAITTLKSVQVSETAVILYSC